MTVGTPSSTMATHEFVVPRSMPMTRSIQLLLAVWGDTPWLRPRSWFSILSILTGTDMASSLFRLHRRRPGGGDELLDPWIFRGHLEGPIQLALDALVEPRRRVRPRQGDAELGLPRLDLHGLARELDRAPRVRARFQGGVGD